MAVAAVAVLASVTRTDLGQLRPGRELEAVSHVASVPTPDKQLRAVVVGNSLADDAFPGVKAALKATGVVKAKNESLPLFGLTAGYDWRSLWTAVLENRRPKVVIAHFGGWDRVFALAHPAYYRALVREAVSILTSRGAEIVWVGLPPLPPNHILPEQRAHLNRIYRKMGKKYPHLVHYVGLGSVIGGPNGEFVEHIANKKGKQLRVRKPQYSAHYCPAGAARIGAAIRKDLATRWALPDPASGWRGGRWTLNHRYHTPPGICAN